MTTLEIAGELGDSLRGLARRVPEHLHVRVQSAWAATEDSEPEPDLAVVPARWTPPDGVRSHPQVAELIVEVAASSLRRDLRIKAPIYAEAGAPLYWVIDLDARQVVVHTDPVEGAYRSVVRRDRFTVQSASMRLEKVPWMPWTSNQRGRRGGHNMLDDCCPRLSRSARALLPRSPG